MMYSWTTEMITLHVIKTDPLRFERFETDARSITSVETTDFGNGSIIGFADGFRAPIFIHVTEAPELINRILNAAREEAEKQDAINAEHQRKHEERCRQMEAESRTREADETRAIQSSSAYRDGRVSLDDAISEKAGNHCIGMYEDCSPEEQLFHDGFNAANTEITGHQVWCEDVSDSADWYKGFNACCEMLRTLQPTYVPFEGITKEARLWFCGWTDGLAEIWKRLAVAGGEDDGVHAGAHAKAITERGAMPTTTGEGVDPEDM